MTWIALIEQELPRMRLYASALLSDLHGGDSAVEEALSELIRFHLAAPPARRLLYVLVDMQVRKASKHPAEERTELLAHVCGFERQDCDAITSSTEPAARKAAG